MRPRAGPSRRRRPPRAARGRSRVHAVGGEALPQLLRVCEVAVVAKGDRAGAAVQDDRLSVRPLRRARRRVARVADRGLALEPAQALLVEDLCDEAHVPEDRQAPALGDGDPGRLLAAVLKGEEPEIGHARDIAAWRTDAENTAHLRGYLLPASP